MSTLPTTPPRSIREGCFVVKSKCSFVEFAVQKIAFRLRQSPDGCYRPGEHAVPVAGVLRLMILVT